MGAFFIYILKSVVCLALFYLFFRLLLSKETFHRFNRIALLSILCLSWLIPLIEIATPREIEINQVVLTVEQLLVMTEDIPVNVDAIAPLDGKAVSISWIHVALFVYLGGILFFACRHFYSLCCLIKLLLSGKWKKIERGITLIVHEKDIAPFSWMKYIVISRKDMEENGREILIHEIAHTHNCHSVDLLVADICIFLQWFNPSAWLLKQELQNIHEYEADETVIKEGINAKEYQLLLIKKAVGTRLYSMANSFNHSKLKKRITMMLKEKSNPWARLKYLYVLPLAAITMTAFARSEVFETVDEISAIKVNDLAAVLQEEVLKDTVKWEILGPARNWNAEIQKWKTGDKGVTVFEKVEQMPEFPGGAEALRKYIAQKTFEFVESDEEVDNGGAKLKRSKLSGYRAFVVVDFTVSATGKVEDASVRSSDNAAFNKIALRIINGMPDWAPAEQGGIPIAVKCSVPVRFSMNLQCSSFSFTKTPSSLILIDGIETSSNHLGNLRAEVIDSVVFITDSVAKLPYGKHGADGVILVTTRKRSQTTNPKSVNTEAREIKKMGAMPEFPVSGYVIDVEGNRIHGVSVTIPGTHYGTITDNNGAFAMNAFNGGELYFSYPGCEPQKIPVASKMKARLEPIYIKILDY